MQFQIRAKIKSDYTKKKKDKQGFYSYTTIVEFIENPLVGKTHYAHVKSEYDNYFVGDTVNCLLNVEKINGKNQLDIYIQDKLFYITNSNFNRILGKIDKLKIDLDAPVWKEEISFLNLLEKKDILLIKFIFEFQDEFLEYYKELDNKNEKYVYEYHSAYHTTSTCARLLSDFDNYEIPESIQKSQHQDYRKWFLQNKELFNSERKELNDLFKEKHYQRWNCMPIHIQRKNGGAHLITEINPNQSKKIIEQLLVEAENFIKSSEINREVILLFGKSSYKFNDVSSLQNRNSLSYSDELISVILKYFEIKIKRPLIENLKNYYRFKNNPNLTFDSNFLNAVGFKHCMECYGKELVSQIENQKEDDDMPF